jgi:hypothetical protein
LNMESFGLLDKFLRRAVIDTFARLNHRLNFFYKGSRPTAKE